MTTVDYIWSVSCRDNIVDIRRDRSSFTASVAKAVASTIIPIVAWTLGKIAEIRGKAIRLRTKGGRISLSIDFGDLKESCFEQTKVLDIEETQSICTHLPYSFVINIFVYRSTITQRRFQRLSVG